MVQQLFSLRETVQCVKLTLFLNNWKQAYLVTRKTGAYTL